MANFGRLTASGVTAINENTVALANFNVDFTLLKISPPQEFLDVGNSLSICRKQEAEEGHIHQTARRLGVIFEALLPPTDRLIRQYGTRASQIAQSVRRRPQQEGGLFSKQVGIDGASIWAAATSSTGALKVHLLACMLARMWDPADAVSIWEELLNSRRAEVKERLQRDGDINIADWNVHASSQSITRKQLGEWDSSARAWLRTADRSPIVLVRQNQLDQIVSKTRNQVNNEEALYGSVIETWKNALTGVESLLTGSPQQMQTGEILLGLHAWHLYPDVNMLGDRDILVEFNDPLVPQGGILTIGLVRNSKPTLQGGLHWSLPLAHLRYYGDPIKRTGKLRGLQNRISLPEFTQTILGVLLKLWDVDERAVESTFKWIQSLHKSVYSAMISAAESKEFNVEMNFLALLSNAVTEFLESSGDQKLLNKRLFNAGRRLGSRSLLGKCTAPYFGLSKTGYLFHLLNTQEAKIKFIRDLMRTQSRFKSDIIIRYMNRESGLEEFASVFPTATNRSTKRAHNGTILKHRSVHKRWIFRNPPEVDASQEDADTPAVREDIFMGNVERNLEKAQDDLENADNILFATDNSRVPPRPNQVENTLNPSHNPREDDTEHSSQADPELSIKNWLNERKRTLEELGEDVCTIEDEPLETLQMNNDIRVVWGVLDEMNGLDERERARDKWEWNRPYGDVIHFSPFLGDPTDVALFLRMSAGEPTVPEHIGFSILEGIFQDGDIDRDLLPAIFCETVALSSEQCARSLRAIASMHQIYKSLPGATIAIKILEWKGSLSHAEWLSSGSNNPSKNDQTDLHFQDEPATTRGAEEEREELDHNSTRLNYFEEAFESAAVAAAPPRRDKSSIFRISIRDLKDHFQATFMNPFELSVAQSFSCVLLFDSGVFDIPPSHMDEIMAISSGDSLFIAAQLLSDPAESRNKGPKLKHIMGNVGRAGTALLKPPDNPRIRKVGVEQWFIISGENWDGQRKDTFGDTSLHLWFTGSSLAIDRRQQSLGEKDVQLFMLETVVSVHGRGSAECGEWMADLDIMKALRDPTLHFQALLEPVATEATTAAAAPQHESNPPAEEVVHDFNDEQYVHFRASSPELQELHENIRSTASLKSVCDMHTDSAYKGAGLELVAIENWMELLHTQTKSCIFLAKGNWQARQAATAISVAKGRKTCILLEETCWPCIAKQFSELGAEDQIVTFIA